MKNIFHLVLITTAVLFIEPVYAQATLQKNPEKLNVLFFLIDNLGWNDFGYTGSNFYESPNIDSLANDARIFLNAYSTCVVCSPSRSSIMTGKYPVRTGITDWIGAKQQETWTRNNKLLPANYTDRLDLKEVTIAEALKEAGYATYFAGKWHLGPEGYWPEDQGFDINKGGVHKGNTGKAGYFVPYDNPRLQDGPKGEYLPERLTQETVSYIKSRKGEKSPFFIFHSFYMVHFPYLTNDGLIEKYQQKKDKLELQDKFGWIGDDVNDLSVKRKVRLNHSDPKYAAAIEVLDKAVGKIINTLKEEGLYENTLIILTSDNGGVSTAENYQTSNLPLKAGMGWAYEGGTRVPLLIRLPGRNQEKSTIKERVIGTDFYPTILEATHNALLPNQHLDGNSLIPLLKGEDNSSKRSLFWHYPHYGNHGGTPYSSVIEDNYKLIRFYENEGYYELYNLKSDPSESHNLVHENPGKFKELKHKLEKFLTEQQAETPIPNPSYISTLKK